MIIAVNISKTIKNIDASNETAIQNITASEWKLKLPRVQQSKHKYVVAVCDGRVMRYYKKGENSFINPHTGRVIFDITPIEINNEIKEALNNENLKYFTSKYIE